MIASKPPSKARLLSPKDRLGTVEQTWRDRGSPMDDVSVQDILDAYNYVFANKNNIPEYPAILDRYVDFLEQVAVVSDSTWQVDAIRTLVNIYSGQHIIPPAGTIYYQLGSTPVNCDRALELITSLPDHAYFADFRQIYIGHIHFAKGDYANARAAYRQDPIYLTSADATFNMAVSCEKLGPDFAEEASLANAELLGRYGDGMLEAKKRNAAEFILNQLSPEQLRTAFMKALIDHPSQTLSILGSTKKDTEKLYDPTPASTPAPGGAA